MRARAASTAVSRGTELNWNLALAVGSPPLSLPVWIWPSTLRGPREGLAVARFSRASVGALRARGGAVGRARAHVVIGEGFAGFSFFRRRFRA